MAETLLSLNPQRLWYYFSEVLKIPRPSKKEEKIISYLVNFGKEHKLETIRDGIGNIIVRKAASPGFEKAPAVCLQGHVDMVCEKDTDVLT
jgi:dipeptidase D